MKHILNTISCAIVYAALAITVSTASKLSAFPELKDDVIEPIKHNWECNYIIRDYYSGNISEHYVDSFEELVSGGIKFTSHNGKTYQIPYPYFEVEINK